MVVVGVVVLVSDIDSCSCCGGEHGNGRRCRWSICLALGCVIVVVLWVVVHAATIQFKVVSDNNNNNNRNNDCNDILCETQRFLVFSCSTVEHSTMLLVTDFLRTSSSISSGRIDILPINHYYVADRPDEQ